MFNGIKVGLLVNLLLATACGDDGSLGVARQRPTAGHYVEVDSGYMVPYVDRIAGTDVEFEMVPVPGNAYSASNRTPYWIGKHEVTLREYAEYAKLYRVFKELEQHERRTITDQNRVDAVSAPTEVYYPRGRFEGVDNLDFPAYSMTLFAAKQYTKWLSLLTGRPYRLPTESEWERACCAGGSGYFWKEETLAKYAVFDLETDYVVEVGSRSPNAWGVHDMYGNVSEWVITAFPQDKSPSQKVPEPQIEPWPPIWIYKGGNFASTLEECLPARRMVVTSEEWEEEANFPQSTTWLGSYSDRVRIGFRIVRPFGKLDKNAMSPFWNPQSTELESRINQKLIAGRGAEGLVDPELPRLIKQLSLGITIDWGNFSTGEEGNHQ